LIGRQLSIGAARHPDSTATVFGARRLTYAELNERACRLANALAALGVRPGDRVATLLHNCHAFIEAYFAAAKLGAVFVPLNFRLVAREVGHLLDGCTPRVLLAGEAFADMLTELKMAGSLPPQVVRIDDRPEAAAAGNAPYEAWLAAQPSVEPDAVVGADDLQLLVHSSGTTGVPKGAMWTHATTLFSSTAKIIDFALGPRDTTVVFGPLFHTGPLMDLALPLLLRGGKLVIGPSRQFDPELVLRTIAEERATVAHLYPTMWHRLLATVQDTSAFDLTSLRLLFTGGETLPVPMLESVYDRFPGVGFVNTYGSTETGAMTTRLFTEDRVRKIGSIGQPAFSVDIRIADDDAVPLPPDEVGELLVRSPFVCQGYWHGDEQTATASRNGWWHTGDLAWRDEEGYLWIAGRKKDVIRTGQENVYPLEVERAIATLAGVAEVGVVGVPDEEWGEVVVAFVVAAPGADLDAAKVVEHCRQHLASYKKPRHVRFVDSLPRTTVSKISRSELKRRFAGA
jgi:acyl-CoA synthetase (AMP-forming)/AMP-acid ligase II